MATDGSDKFTLYILYILPSYTTVYLATAVIQIQVFLEYTINTNKQRISIKYIESRIANAIV